MQHYNRLQGRRGYALLTFLLMLLALLSGWLGMVIYQQAKAHRAQYELIVETLHQARISALNYYQQQQSWPLLVLPEVIEHYVSNFEVVLQPQPIIRVKLASPKMLPALQQQLAASSIVEDWLVLQLVTSPLGERPEADENSNWLPRVGESAKMETHLDMDGFSLQQTRYLATQYATVARIDTDFAAVQQLATQRANAESIESEVINSDTLQGDVMQINSAVIEQSSQQRLFALTQVAIGNLVADNTSSQTLYANTAVSEVVESHLLQAESVQANRLQSSNLDTNQFTTSQLSANSLAINQLISTQGNIHQALVQQILAEQITASSTQAQSIAVSESVQLSVTDSEPIMQLQQELQQLYQNLQNCLYSTRWCEAIQATPFQLQSCIGCNQQQTATVFTATMAFSGDECVHGCAIALAPEMSNIEGLTWNCYPSSVTRLSVFATECSLSKALAENQSWQQAITIRLHNQKEPQVYNQRSVFINWQRQPAYCPGFTVAEPVVNGFPVGEEILFFPDTPFNETAQVFASSFDCNLNYSSKLVCNGTANCGGDGTWQNITTSCTCTPTF